MLHWHRFNLLRCPYCVLCAITNPKTPSQSHFHLLTHTGHVCCSTKLFAQHISIYEHHNTLSSCHRFFFFFLFLSETDISKQFLPLNTARHQPHSFPRYKSNVIMLKERERKRVATSIFDGSGIRYARRVNIWPLPRCINRGQIGGQTSIFHPHFALGFHTY